MIENKSWKKVRLGDIITIKHGWPFKTEFISDELSGSPIVVNIGNFEYTGGFRFERTRTREYRGRYPAEYELKPGDILLVMTCQTSEGEILGVPARVPDDGRIYLHNQRLGKVIVTQPEKADSNYLYWLFVWREFNHELYTTASGTKILHTAPKRIANFNFNLPSLGEQRRIAAILDGLQDKILLNASMDKTLDEMSSAIFNHWFVDFEFPDEAGKRYKSSGGEMVDSDLGKIPKGWAVGKLSDHINVIKGCSYRSEDLRESEIALVTLKSIDRGGGFNQDGYKEYVGDYKSDQVLKDGEVVVAQTDLTQKAEVVGRPAIVNSLGRYTKLVASLDLQIVRPKDNFSKYFVYHVLGTESFHNHALSYTNGTTVMHLNKNAVPDFISIIPPSRLLAKFDALIESIQARTTLCARGIRTLSQLRDLLVPKLISGKIKVPVEAV